MWSSTVRSANITAETTSGESWPARGAAFTGWHVTVNDQMTEGDRVVSRLTVGGTHTGAMMGIEPTGKVVGFSIVFIDRLVDGITLEGWHSPVYYSLFRQLGAYPE